jgi:fructokinase
MQAPPCPWRHSVRIGIDLGGTKIAAVALAANGAMLAMTRRAAPQGDYAATLAAIAETVTQLGRQANAGDLSEIGIGVGMPGSISPRSGLVQNANSTWLNGRPFGEDLARALGHQVRCANDANCFALSEAIDGAGQGAASVFGVILGTGCGGGLVYGGQLIDGPRGIGGEWGHNPLPWPNETEIPGPQCWCGRRGCIETWVSGSGLAADHARTTGESMTAEAIAKAAAVGQQAAQASLARHASRLARALATVINIFDPHVIVLGGGLSQLAHLYSALPGLIASHIFAECRKVNVLPPKWGDASGVRGAARLWN